MSSITGKQDMSMDEILASIRSYVSEGQNLPKSNADSFQSTEVTQEKRTYSAEVIHLTDEIVPIETVDLPVVSSTLSPLLPIEKPLAEQNAQYTNAQSATNSCRPSDNPFSRLQSEIVASIQAPANPSVDDLLNQLATPLIKNWLDQNLQKLVETIVEKEIERMRRS